MGDTGAEMFLMDGCSGPGERIGAGIVAFDEGIGHDPDFVAKTAEIIGLYLDPPEGALVLAVDEP